MKKLIALLLAAVMVFGLVACGGKGGEDTKAPESTGAGNESKPSAESKPDGKETYHFEVVSKGFQATYWQAVFKGAENEVKKLNDEAGYEKYTMKFVGPDSESDIAVQVQEFTSALNVKPDAIGLAALDVTALVDGIKSAQSAGIPIIGFDSGVPNAPEGSVLANASTDNYAAGKMAAEGMYKAIKDRIGDKQVRIGVVNQDVVGESTTNRGLGFIDAMIDMLQKDGKTVYKVGNEKLVNDTKANTAASEKEADVIIEARVPSATTVELCATEASVILNQADTIAIYGSNQTAAEGVVTANETLNVCGTGDNQIIAVGFDSGSVLKAAINDGTMYGAVTQAPVAIGEIMVDLMAASAAGETVSDKDTGCAFYTAENINDEAIAQNLYD